MSWPYSKSNLVLECIRRSEIMEEGTLAEAFAALDRLSVSQQAYGLGLKYLEEGNYFLAGQQFALVIPESMHYPEAQRLLQQAEADFIDYYLSTAKGALDDGDFKQAINYLAEAIDLKPLDVFLVRLEEYEERWTAHGLSALADTKERFANHLISLEQAEEVLWALEADGLFDAAFIQRELIYLGRLKASHEAFSAGNARFEEGDYLGAIEQYALVIEDDVDFGLAQERIIQALQAFRDSYLLKARAAVEEHDFSSAVLILEEALSLRSDPVLQQELENTWALWEEYESEQVDIALDTFNQRLKTYAETLKTIELLQSQGILGPDYYGHVFGILGELYASQQAFELGEESFAAGSYLEAIHQYDLVSETDFYYGDALEKSALAKSEFTKLVSAEVRTAVASNEYASALAIVDDALEQLPLAELYQLRHIVVEEEASYFVERKLQQAMDAFEPQGNYLAAKEIILAGLDRFPDNDLLQEALAFYQQFEPVLLSELKPIVTTGGKFERDTKNAIRDNTGRLYPAGSYLRGSFDRKEWVLSTTYILRGAFTDFTGTIAVSQDTRSKRQPATVRIFGDGILLFEQKGIRRGFIPVRFHLDLTDVQQLTIEYERSNEDQPAILIADAFLAKNYHGYPTQLNYSALYYPPAPIPEESGDEREFVDAVLSEADSAFKPNGNFAAAVNIILDGLQKYSKNRRLLDAKTYYESFRPVLLFHVPDFYCEGGFRVEEYDNLVDNKGVVHRAREYARLQINYRDIIAAYYLGAKYTDFYGTITFDNRYRDSDAYAYVRIMGDGQTLLMEDGHPDRFRHGDFHLDITGVEVLVIEAGYEKMYLGLPGPILVKPHLVRSYTGFPYQGRK